MDTAETTSPGGPVVVTAAGAVRGVAGERASSWKGIRYAQPPTGARRWRAPVAAEPWEGCVDATAFGAAAPQKRVPAIDLGPDPVLDEDCLFLNVWRPEGGAESKPVMVWIHGGAYTYGSASQPLFDGTELAATGDVVVVTLNYRIGPLGFLDLSSFSDAEHVFDSNLALRDVLLALEWVRDNIAAFGGDAGRVTVFGESAGGGLVTTLLATPAAAGLFHAAIAESSPASSIYGRERARAVAERFLAAAQVAPDDLDAVRDLPVDTIVAAGAEVYNDVPSTIPGTLAFAPVVDGDLVPEHPITVLSEGRGHPVPLVIGTNRDEATLFKFMKSPLIPITRDSIERMFALMMEDNPGLVPPERDDVLAVYAGVREKVRGLDIATDIGFRMPAVWVASGHSRVAPTRLYRFDYATPMLRLMGIRAAHATELPYVWGDLHSQKKDPTFLLGGRRTGEALSARLLGRWTAFATTGVPGDDWPAYDENGRDTLVIGAEDRVVPDLDGRLRAGWGDAVLSFR
ncbi:carboxylesterase/lipase family protein [Leifsonia shinshuensis]